ncbi:hypothetical protein VP01_7942g1, partial [Puccinia sorghi]
HGGSDLNWNEVIIGTPTSVKRSFLKGLSPQVQEQVQRWHNLIHIWRSRDGSSLLPDLKEVCDVARADFDMMELMEEMPHSCQRGACTGRSGGYGSGRDFYFPGSREKIEGIPQDVVQAANPEGSSQAKPEATSASGVVVGAEVWAVQSDERVMFGGWD